MTETSEINLEVLKSVLEGLAQPATLNEHPVVNSHFVQDYVSQQSEGQRLPPGRTLGWALAELWRQRFLPPARVAKLKRQWNTFLVLEVGFFFPFRQGKRLPNGLPQIGALLADRDHLALVLADGNEQQAEALLKEEASEFWEMLTPSNKKDALVLGASAVLARRDAALRELAKALHEIEISSNETERLPSSRASAAHSEVSASTPSSSDALDYCLKTCLPARPSFIPTEWQSLMPTITSTPRVIIQGQAGSGKTTFMRALAHEFRQAGCLPVVVCLMEYAPLAKEMDVLHFAATRGSFGQVCRHDVLRLSFEQALVAAEQAGRLVVLADQSDDVFEYELPDLAPRLDRFRRLVLTERGPRLPVKRETAATVRVPDLAAPALTELLNSVKLPQSVADHVLAEFDRAGATFTPGLAVFAAQTRREAEDHPVLTVTRWIDWQLRNTRPTGQIIAEVDKARRLLRYLAGIQFDIALHPEPTTRLTRENVRRAFWSLPLQLDEADQGWRLMELSCRAGLLSHVKEEWIFCNAAVERALAAEYADEKTTWVSLQPQYRALMKWTAALVAHRGAPQRQEAFFNQLRSALGCAAPLSTLEAAEFVLEFNQLGSRAAEVFKAELGEALQLLMQSVSSQIRDAAAHYRQLLDEEARPIKHNDSRLAKRSQIESLDGKAGDLAELLHQLGITPPAGTAEHWPADRRVLNALLDGLSGAATLDLKRHCAAWLHRADLSKRVEIQVHARVPWKSRSRSALEVVADLALDLDQTADTRALAHSLLAKEDWLLQLWQAGDKYTPVVYELLLALDKRLILMPAAPGRHEWRIVD